MKSIFLVILVTAGGVSFAQNSEDSVKNVIRTLFLAMKNSDTTIFKTTFVDSAILQND